MASATRKAFEFLYVRRGQTSLWDLADTRLDASPGAGEPIGARLAEHDHKREWYRVVMESGPGEDAGDSIGRAEGLATAGWKLRHPGQDVVA